MTTESRTLYLTRPPDDGSFGTLLRNLLLVLLVVLLVPLIVLAIGAPIALLLRLLIEAAQRVS